ncbi:MAG: hypothetical protein IPK82_01635 [Polyangiaceae bacterium]|nr:hypothetical protein [Polyangiaceae bacterium]
MRFLLFVSLVCAVVSLGCINTDAAIFVDPSTDNPALQVQSAALGTSVSGGFSLSLHLGARAADSSDVALQSFTLVTEDEKTVLVESLPLAASGATFPVTVEPDTTVDIDLTIDFGEDLVEQAVADAICNAGSVRFKGAITDSLRGTTVPVVTDAVVPTGCD